MAERCFETNRSAKSYKGSYIHVVYYEDETVALISASEHIPAAMYGNGRAPVDVLSELIDAEMATGVDLYRGTVIADSEPGDDLEHEVRFHIPQIHPDLFGTADTKNYRRSAAFLRIYDFKYGAGVQVEVEENEQVTGYALGAALLMSNSPLHRVELVIVQPRADHFDGPVRRYEFEALDLLRWADIYKVGAARTDDPDAPILAGDWCRWCPAAGICPTLRENVETAMLDEFPVDKRPNLAVLNDALKRVPAVKAWASAVMKLGTAEAKAGRLAPDFKLIQKRAIRKWIDEDSATRALLGNDIPEADIISPAALKSPAEVESAVGKKDFADLAGNYVSAVSSGLTIVPLSDNRPAVLFDVKAGFTDVTKQTDLVATVADYNDLMGITPPAKPARVTDEDLLDIPASLRAPAKLAEINPLD